MLQRWEEHPNLDSIIDSMRASSEDEQSFNLAVRLVTDVFRNMSFLEYFIIQNTDRLPNAKIKRLLYPVLNQIFYQESPIPEIAVDTAMRYAKRKLNSSKSFINYFLRKSVDIFRSPEFADFKSKLKGHRKYGLHPEIFKSWNSFLSTDELSRISSLIATPANLTCRSLNGPLESPYLEKLEIENLTENFHFYKISQAHKFFQDYDLLEQVYIQDPSTLLAINLLNPQQGENIADLCAAPGGKSLLLSELIGETGSITACDNSEIRLRRLVKNTIHKLNITTRLNDVTESSLKLKSFDAVIIDVPCSNTGVFRKKPDAQWTFSQQKITELNKIQLEILAGAAKHLKTNGRLIYSTCSMEPQENIQLIEQFLSENKHFELIESKQLFPSENHDGAFACLLRAK